VDDSGKVVARGSAAEALRVSIPDAKAWSPDAPHLYLVRLRYGDDSVQSYFGLRSVALSQDSAGVNRVFLNGKPLFLFGLLDQGYWPEGIYTAPTDKALRSDIEMTKAWGFNTIRKHMKVEPARWYYWADKLGVLVLQDFPAVTDALLPQGAEDLTRTANDAQEIEGEMHAMVRTLSNHPSIVAWVPFNEGWGQFETKLITKLFRSWDLTRLVDDASGWIDRGAGDFLDKHSYPRPSSVTLEKARIALQGEYGGGGLLVKDHDWNTSTSYQYAHFDTPEQLLHFFTEQAEAIRSLKSQGLAGAIYTQTTDVENEINGLMTYDRIPKLDAPKVKQVVATTISDP
jgi:beta-galactosidase/beta-glucuronidase